jgi:ubiquinone/menaquinone biosynthesis C-methylase UbiE
MNSREGDRAMAWELRQSPAEITVPTREGYDRWSAIYDSDGNPLIALEAPVFARMLGEVRGLAVADIGAGTGRHSLYLVDRGARVVAVDLSLGMLSRARAKPGSRDVAFVCADCAAGLPLAQGSFDRVVSCLVAEHMPSLESHFGEMRRICRSGGFIVVTNVHPAMHLKGVRARFNDPASGMKIYPRGHEHAISEFVMAARRTGLVFEEMVEVSMNEETAAVTPRARPYIGWPMLLAMKLSSA